MDLHVCSHLDPMEPTGMIGVHGYSHLELVTITTSGDVPCSYNLAETTRRIL